MGTKKDYAIGKYHKAVEKDGKKTTARISIAVKSYNKDAEQHIKKSMSGKGFTSGKAFKTENKEVLIPGTFWLNDVETPDGIADAMDGKQVFFEKGYIKGVDKARYASYNAETENSSNVFQAVKVEDKASRARITGNLNVFESGGKNYITITNSVKLKTKEGEDWAEKTIEDHKNKLSALGLSSKVSETDEGVKYLNISAFVFGSSTSILTDEKLLKKIKEEKPFVVLETSLQNMIEGSNIMVNKNNNITPLGVKSEAVFKGFEDKMTKIERKEVEDLYAEETEVKESETETNDENPVVY